MRSYSELNSSISSIKNVSLGKDFKTANVQILTQDGNLRKLKFTYDEAENSLRSLVMSEQHYVTVGEKFSQVLDNKIMQMGAYAATAVSMYEVIDVARQGAQYVTEFHPDLVTVPLPQDDSLWNIYYVKLKNAPLHPAAARFLHVLQKLIAKTDRGGA